MKRYARTVENTVQEIIEHDDSVIAFEVLYSQEIVSTCIVVGPEVQPGWRVVGGSLLPPLTPEQQEEETFSSDSAAYLARLCLKIDDEVGPQVLKDGFTYDGARIQADPVAQQNATGFLTAVSSGVPVPFPVEWRTKDNTSYQIASPQALGAFAAKMLQFVQTVFHARWQLKDALRASTTAVQAQQVYASGVAAMRQIGDNL
jgi:hypothetical protein